MARLTPLTCGGSFKGVILCKVGVNIESLAKQIYDLMERLLQNPQYRSILVGKNNNVLNFLLMAHHEAFCEEMKRKYGDRYE